MTQQHCVSDGVGCACGWPENPCEHEAYVKALEQRIQQQREQLRALEKLRDGPHREAKRRYSQLHRLLGEKTEKLARQYEGLRALNVRMEDLEERLRISYPATPCDCFCSAVGEFLMRADMQPVDVSVWMEMTGDLRAALHEWHYTTRNERV